MHRPRDEDPATKQIIDQLELEENQLDAFLREESADMDTTLLQQRIMQTIRKKQRSRSVGEVMLRVYEGYKAVAALLVLAMIIAIVFFGTVEAARESFLSWVIELTSVFTSLGKETIPIVRLEVMLPDDWRGHYYPAYLPTGYELTGHHSIDLQRYLQFQHPNGNVITFWQGNKDKVALALDNEDVLEVECTVADYPALLIIKGEWKMLIWRTENTAFRVEGTIANDEIIRIAENLKQIE